MNGNIMMGFGSALVVWGLIALVGYQRLAEGLGLLGTGAAMALVGRRHPKRGQ